MHEQAHGFIQPFSVTRWEVEWLVVFGGASGHSGAAARASVAALRGSRAARAHPHLAP